MQSHHRNVSLTSLTKVSLFVRNSHKLSYRASNSGWNNIFSPNSTKDYLFLTNSIYPMFSFCKYVDIDWSPRKFSKSMTYTQIFAFANSFQCWMFSEIQDEYGGSGSASCIRTIVQAAWAFASKFVSMKVIPTYCMEWQHSISPTEPFHTKTNH